MNFLDSFSREESLTKAVVDVFMEQKDGDVGGSFKFRAALLGWIIN